MAPKSSDELPAAKLTDLLTTIDSGSFIAPSGPMAWGTVEISYASEGLEPKVSIRVPVLWDKRARSTELLAMSRRS